MPEGVGYGPQNTASAGLNLNIIGEGIYGHSGLVAVADSEIDLINSDTGSYYCRVQVLFTYASDSYVGDDYIYRIRYNGVIVWQHRVVHVAAEFQFLQDIPLIIPPFTQVRLTAENATDDSAHNQLVVLAGRIYK